MLASIPSQHLESDCRPCRNPKRDSTSTNHALMARTSRKKSVAGYSKWLMRLWTSMTSPTSALAASGASPHPKSKGNISACSASYW